MDSEIMPASAWVQGVFVCLFVLFTVWVLSWISRENKETKNFFWGIEEEWREFSKQQRIENNECIRKISESVRALAVVIEGLVSRVEVMSSETKRLADRLDQVNAEVERAKKQNKKDKLERGEWGG